MTDFTQTLSGWNNYPKQVCKVLRADKYRDVHITNKRPLIARGNGLSYGDASFNSEGYVLLMHRLNRILHFDRSKGTLSVEAGATLADILSVVVKAGWFLPVTPGTQYVTIGGCVAMDVHGKEHHKKGNFCQHIIELELINADNHVIQCSAKHNSEWFWSTIGGLGLTGIITSVTLKLVPIRSAYLSVNYTACSSLEETLTTLGNVELNDDYSVAWLDCLPSKQSGRAIVMTAHFTDLFLLPEKIQFAPWKSNNNRRLAIPFNCPTWLLNKHFIRCYNNYFYTKNAGKVAPFIQNYQDFFFPLDKIKHWNRLYGKKGFIQYQLVLPFDTALIGLQTIFAFIKKTKLTVFLAVLKCFGTSQQGLLSFPMPGFTLALDIPLNHRGLFSLLNDLDEIVISHGGRVYLAKDARLTPANFRRMYPNYPQWLTYKKKFDSNNIFSSSLAKRLEIGS